MTVLEKLEQDKAYRQYLDSLVEEFGESEDGEFIITQEENEKWKHLNQDLQIDDLIE